MIKWPVFVGRLNSVKESDKNLVAKFFSSAAEVGAGSVGYFMKYLKRVWSKHDSRSVDDSGDESPMDVVNY